MSSRFCLRTVLALLFLSTAATFACAEEARPRKIVLIAGKKSHGPVGNGIHDYPWSVKLLKVMLDNSNIADKVRTECHFEGWPEDPKTLDDADTIMVISDGRDGDLYEEAPPFQSEEKLAAIEKQIRRGCGFVTFHFSTFAPDKYADQILNWTGGYFDWETDGKRQWYSAITTKEAEVQLGSPDHPVSRGLTPFRMKEEFYYNIRFDPNDKALRPIWVVPDLPGREPDGRVVAWARERADGGRGFGTTCGHFYENWKQEHFRRLILNALAWTAKVDVPAGGVNARYYTHAEITAALAGKTGTTRAVVDDRPIRALILTGHQYPGHKWKDTTPVIKGALARDPRMQVDVSEKIEDLADEQLGRYDVLILNYCNWESPGLSDAAKAGFVKFLSNGGGLCIVHFANGAFHFSLPKAGDSDWPEFRKICRRVWDHTAGKSGHDAYGSFTVEIENREHPITRGLEAFQTTDELYFRQQGDEPIEVLAKAKSQITGQWEPMAFVYPYGKGRVFQTVLGHSVESLQTPGTAALLRRGAAWTAGREPAEDAILNAAAESAPATDGSTEGKFGKGWNARKGGLFVEGKPEYRGPPMTVECWARLNDRQPYNILVAHELKTSGTHWELFSMAGNGRYTVYTPGLEPDHVRSELDLCDDRWHYVAMTYEPERIRLFVDGKQAAEHAVKPRGQKTVAGGLAFGSLFGREIGCQGSIDEIRISRGIRTIDRVPDAPFTADEQTVGLWHLDTADEQGAFADESRLKNPARRAPPAQVSSARPKIEGHWGEDAIGFRWTEQDSVDNRWNDSKIGRWLASNLPIPNQPTVGKGLSIRIGDAQQASICFDTATMTLRAAWTGGFLKFDPARFGLIAAPKIAGDLLFTAPPTTGWKDAAVQYRGLIPHRERVVLNYTVDKTEVRESPWIEERDGIPVITRSIEVAAHWQPLRLTLLSGSKPTVITEAGRKIAKIEDRGRSVAVALVGGDQTDLVVSGDSDVTLNLPASDKPAAFKLLMASVAADRWTDFAKLAADSPPAQSLEPLTAPGPPHWLDVLETQGVRGEDNGPYVIDTLTIPFDNPYGALMFTSGHDFFDNGNCAVCTVHGDVWLVQGIDDKLQRLTWTRYATGLFQPLGLRIVDDVVYVLGRDQITRLYDRNSDGEADYYECFSNIHKTSTGGHDYVTCLETDREGNFYFMHATEGVVKVSRDGRHQEIIATGFRNPNGLGVSPGGVITASPQEGDWTPASGIFVVGKGGHYGYGGPRVTKDRPLGYDPPLCWIPRLQDNSSGGQVWVTSFDWGPLSGDLLHFSFGKCRMMLVVRESSRNEFGMQSSERNRQGGVVDFPLEFESGVMRGRFHPRDGQLYVTGLRGWTTSATHDGCLQRVRYTGQPLDLPVAAKAYKNGISITYGRKLQREAAENPNNYRIQQWNYRYRREYGSPDYKLSDPKQEGRDELDAATATLLEDDRTVFLEIDDFKPSMQLTVEAVIAADDATPIHRTLAYSPQQLSDRMDPSKLRPRRQSNQPDPATLRPGIATLFEQNGMKDARVSRMIAHQSGSDDTSTPFLRDAPFLVTYEGWIRAPLPGAYHFEIVGDPRARLTINDCDVTKPQPGRITGVRKESGIRLEKGLNKISVTSSSQSLRLDWKGADFPLEPIPPAQLFHMPSDPALIEGAQIRRGLGLFANRHCFRCHRIGDDSEAKVTLPESVRSGPSLADAGKRLNADWAYHWVLDPTAMRDDATMPRLLSNDAAGLQQAADLTAWLATLGRPDPANAHEASADTGESLYSTLGCIACHRLTPRSTEDEHHRISLRLAPAKYHPHALVEFLQQPGQGHPGTRMPDFHLSEEEATALAAFLKNAAPPQQFKERPPVGDPVRGRETFEKLQCASCHSIDNTPPQPPKFASVFGTKHGDRGCLADEDQHRHNVPRFGFTPADRQALRTFLQRGPESVSRVSPAEDASRLVKSLRCNACHDRDDIRSPRAQIIAEETESGLAPEVLPSLTWAGEKLKAQWMQDFIAGRLTERPRPWLKARMPAFPDYAAALAHGLAAEHAAVDLTSKDKRAGVTESPDLPRPAGPPRPQTRPRDPEVEQKLLEDLVELGRQLTLKDRGLDCRQCHGVGREEPLGDDRTKIAPGINFSHVKQRLRYDFYQRFVLDPPRYDINSRMPKLATDGVHTKSPILGGDAHEQFDAIWEYIQSCPAETRQTQNSAPPNH